MLCNRIKYLSLSHSLGHLFSAFNSIAQLSLNSVSVPESHQYVKMIIESMLSSEHQTELHISPACHRIPLTIALLRHHWLAPNHVYCCWEMRWLRFQPYGLLVLHRFRAPFYQLVSFCTYRDYCEKTLKLIFAGKVFPVSGIVFGWWETSISSRIQRKIN